MRRRLEERAVAIPVPGGDLVLDGVFRAGRGADGMLIAAPHPEYGGSMEAPVVAELAWAAHKAGLASLRFNWRGVGASVGTASGDVAAADADFDAASRYLAETVRGSLVAAGYSFGAAAAARAVAREPRVHRLLLVAPPVRMLDTESIRRLDLPVLILTAQHDAIAPPAALAALAGELPQVHLVAIPEADHFFQAGLATLGAEAASWLGA